MTCTDSPHRRPRSAEPDHASALHDGPFGDAVPGRLGKIRTLVRVIDPVSDWLASSGGRTAPDPGDRRLHPDVSSLGMIAIGRPRLSGQPPWLEGRPRDHYRNAERRIIMPTTGHDLDELIRFVTAEANHEARSGLDSAQVDFARTRSAMISPAAYCDDTMARDNRNQSGRPPRSGC